MLDVRICEEGAESVKMCKLILKMYTVILRVLEF